MNKGVSRNLWLRSVGTAASFISALFILPCGAQQRDIPSDPQVRKVDARAAWELRNTAALKEPNPSGLAVAVPAPVEIRSVEVVRTSSVQRIIVQMSDRSSNEIWVGNGMIYQDRGNFVSSVPVDPMAPGIWNLGREFFGTQWVTGAKFKGRVNYQGRACNYYENLPVPSSDAAGETASSEDTAGPNEPDKAWIDAETRLPVAVVNAQGSFVYRFLPAPESDLSLPIRFSTYRQKLEAEARRNREEASKR